MKNAISALLIFCLILSSSACSKTKKAMDTSSETSPSEKTSATEKETETEAESETETETEPEPTRFSVKISTVFGWLLFSGGLFFDFFYLNI